MGNDGSAGMAIKSPNRRLKTNQYPHCARPQLYAPKSPASQSDYTGAEHTNTFSFVYIRLKFMSTFVETRTSVPAYSRTHSAPQHALPDTKIHRYGQKWCAWLGLARLGLALSTHNHHWPGLAWSFAPQLSTSYLQTRRDTFVARDGEGRGGGVVATYPQDTKPNEARRSHQYKPYDYRYNYMARHTDTRTLWQQAKYKGYKYISCSKYKNR